MFLFSKACKKHYLCQNLINWDKKKKKKGERAGDHSTTTKIGPVCYERALQMTIFQRNKKTERGRQRFGGEGKKGKKCAWNWGTKGRKHSPGHIKDIKKKTNRKHVWHEDTGFCGDRQWVLVAWWGLSSLSVSRHQRELPQSGLRSGLCTVGTALERDLTGGHKRPFLLLLIGFSLLIYLSGVWMRRAWLGG